MDSKSCTGVYFFAELRFGRGEPDVVRRAELGVKHVAVPLVPFSHLDADLFLVGQVGEVADEGRTARAGKEFSPSGILVSVGVSQSFVFSSVIGGSNSL